MTTIVVYEGWLAADGRYTDENEILDDHTQKIVCDREDGLITTGAGEGGPLEEFMRGAIWTTTEWLPGGGPVFDKDTLKRFKECTPWVYRPGDKHIYQLAKGGFDPLPIKGGPPQGIGSGSVYAKAALVTMIRAKKAGYLSITPKQMVIEALEVAKDIDLYSGGHTQLVRLR